VVATLRMVNFIERLLVVLMIQRLKVESHQLLVVASRSPRLSSLLSDVIGPYPRGLHLPGLNPPKPSFDAIHAQDKFRILSANLPDKGPARLAVRPRDAPAPPSVL
jgi:hypothetical protein